jgi:virulence-associated protein VagC
MANRGVARIFMHGRSQAVRLPQAFRLPGDRVRVRRVKNGILLEPMVGFPRRVEALTRLQPDLRLVDRTRSPVMVAKAALHGAFA